MFKSLLLVNHIRTEVPGTQKVAFAVLPEALRILVHVLRDNGSSEV